MTNKKPENSIFEKVLKNKILLTIILSLVVFWIILWLISPLYNLDRTIWEEIYKSFTISKNSKISNNIALIWIDEKTVNKIWRFPFSREEYIPVIKNLNEAGATIIGFDMIFADRTEDKIDKKFAKAIKEAWNIILWGWVVPDEKNRAIFEFPLDVLYKNSLWVGIFKPETDKINNIVYSIKPFLKLYNTEVNHFSIALLKAYYSKTYLDKEYLTYKNNYKNWNKYFYLNPEVRVPYDNRWDKELWIDFVPNYKIPFFSFLDIKNKNFPKNFFKDRIVIIWATAKGIKDIFHSYEWVKFGIYTHANMVNTILSWNYRVYFPSTLELFLLYLLIVVSIYINITMVWKKLLLSNIWIIWFFFFIVLFIVMIYWYILNYASQFIFSVIITLTVSNILKSFLEDKNKTKLNKALWQYVSKDIANEILYWEWKINLDWERKMISIFFSDIEGFTTISEKMNPEELVIFLREYLWAMSNIIMDEKWLIDKYEWDAIMALWWVFGHEETSTYDNCFSALMQKEKLKELNIWWKERFWEELKIRMWINTWEAIVWNIWAEWRKMEFTALWDSVNLASRLEEVNKKYWTYLCVSEIVYLEQKDNFEFRYLDQIRVKWKTIPVKIYELISLKLEIEESKKNIIIEFEKAINLYLDRKFNLAIKIFEKLSKIWDNPSKTYISRCEVFIEKSPEEDWDGVWTMKSK